MDLSYDVEQAMLRDTLARYLRNAYASEHRKRIVASATGWSGEVWRALADMGCLGLVFKEENGGFGGDPVSVGLVAEALGRHLVVEPFLSAVLLAGRMVEALGSDEQRSELLPPLMAGDSVPALAWAEGSGPPWSAPLRTTARRDGSGWLLNGRKTAVLGAPGADWLAVSAQVEGVTQIAVFVVAPDAPGLASSAWPTTHEQHAADLNFDNVRLEADARLGGPDADASQALAQVLDGATAVACADALGAMDAVVESTADYLKTRTQFGQPLSRFQALQHRMAEMAVCVHEARAVTLLALIDSRAAPRERALAVSAAKAKVGRCAQFIGRNAVQLHGAVGATQDLPIGNFFRRLTAFEASFGSSAEHLQRYADLIGLQPLAERTLLRERA